MGIAPGHGNRTRRGRSPTAAIWRIRQFSMSATMMSPFASGYASSGVCSWPRPEPARSKWPYCQITLRVAMSIRTMTSCSSSLATMVLPSGEMKASSAANRWPGARLPRTGKRQSTFPLSSTNSNRPLPRSAMRRPAPNREARTVAVDAPGEGTAEGVVEAAASGSTEAIGRDRRGAAPAVLAPPGEATARSGRPEEFSAVTRTTTIVPMSVRAAAETAHEWFRTCPAGLAWRSGRPARLAPQPFTPQP